MPARKVVYCCKCGIRVYSQESRRKRRSKKPICEPCQELLRIML